MLIISWGEEWDGDMLPMKQSGLVTKGSVRNYWGGATIYVGRFIISLNKILGGSLLFYLN